MTRIGMVCEASSDHRTATTLAARILDVAIETRAIDPAVDGDPRFSKWTHLDRHSKRWPNHRLHGRWGSSQPVHGQTLAARKAILLFDGKVDAVILMVDADAEDAARYAALERARIESTLIPPECIVIAVPKPEREAWNIAGFEPKDQSERDRLAEVKRDLGKDPREHSHLLKHGDDQAKRNAKRILALLTDDDSDRAQACIAETVIDTLRKRGQDNGLAAFLDAVPRLRSTTSP